MTKYSVSIPWHLSVIVEVEAGNEQEAIAKAEEIAAVDLCHHCSKKLEPGEQNIEYPVSVEII